MPGMLNSFNSGAFQISCLRFLNTFVETADNYRERVHIQAELEDAGLDIPQLKKLLSKVRNLQPRDRILQFIFCFTVWKSERFAEGRIEYLEQKLPRCQLSGDR